MRVIYTLFIYIYASAIHLAAMFSKQARSWVVGRQGLLGRMQRANRNGDKLAWFHCASLGEFEQGRPVIEAFRKEFADYKVLLTFFSPSGYDVRKDYPGADYVFYLPLDSPGNVVRFLDIWKPRLAVFVKYEYWFNYLHVMQQRELPIVVISAAFRPGQHFFKGYGFWFRKYLKRVTHFFVQNSASLELLRSIGVNEITISGDTRFDRVRDICRHPTTIPHIESFVANSMVLVAGSTWEKDEMLIASAIRNPDLHVKLIIAPHHITESGLMRLHQLFGGHTIRLSALHDQVPDQVRVVIVDSIGLLSHLYRYGNMAYVGGGFGTGIHNILEAATFGLPVFFGPKHQKFVEAIELRERGGAMAVGSANELRMALEKMLTNTAALQQAAATCEQYVKEKTGATKTIISYLRMLLASSPH